MKLTSKDGTSIAYEKSGQGPALILVDGAFCHRKFGPLGELIPLLASRATVYHYDRRGRNESGDRSGSTLANELEDLRAVIEVAGDQPIVFGMSSGAALALHAAEAGFPISKLILYEPPFHVDAKEHEGHLAKLKMLATFLDRGDHDRAVRFFQADVVGIPRLIVSILRITPLWKKLRAVAPTLRYDLAALDGGFLPTARLKKIAIPTVVIMGEKSPKFLQDSAKATAAAISGSKLIALKDQSHNFSAKRLAPVLAQEL